MKKLIIVNGTMGVGKSTVCQLLLDKLKPGVYLDGDWCWNMNPFIVSDENKAMVLDNIVHLLKNYLSNSGYEARGRSTCFFSRIDEGVAHRMSCSQK
ncbi:MAG: AAA family ATPase [Veillonellales bacterium]